MQRYRVLSFLVVCVVDFSGAVFSGSAGAGDFWAEYHGSDSDTAQPSLRFSPNPNAGYPGADLPPTSAYRAPGFGEAGGRVEREALPALDAGQYSGRSVVETPGGTLVCAPPDYQGRVMCR